jgi:predicted DNA-binding protein (UPF0251 family)
MLMGICSLIRRIIIVPRPFKCRRVEYLPDVTYFKPVGIPLRALEEIHLSVEEAEALRLKDLNGLDQEPASERMHISRPTFQRILASARQKVADAILNGKSVRIGGGNFEMAAGSPQCRKRLKPRSAGKTCHRRIYIEEAAKHTVAEEYGEVTSK